MPLRTVQKVVAYVVASDQLLVFVHPLHPQVGVQVPAGTIEPGESPLAAVLREAHEETGLTGFGEPEYLGVAVFDMSLHGRSEVQERHFFRLSLPEASPAQWRHVETSAGTAKPEVFEFSWVPLTAVPELAAGQGAYVDALRRAA